MALFKNSFDSHKHSLNVLNLLLEYDAFLDSLTTIADMGCGCGVDSLWWANLATRDDPPEPHNYIVYAVDKDLRGLTQEAIDHPNIKKIEGDFEERVIPRQVDLIWAHDVLQYARDPLKCLAAWKETISTNGMLVVSVPQTTYIDTVENRLIVSNHSHQYYSYNLLNLIYMLAMSGFDCRDAYFYREPDSPWLYAAVYASEHGPLTGTPSWYDLAEKNLISDSLINSVQRNGFAKLDEIVVSWLDKDNYIIRN